MILITGAGGKTGRKIVDTLTQSGAAVRAFGRRPLGLIGVEDIVGDLENEADWRRAAAGVRKIYHICPNMHPAEIAVGRLALAAARAAGVEHFVYHSVLHPQTEEMPHHWAKLRVEEALFASGLPFTILQPTAYMQNLLPQWQTICEAGLLTLPYPVETRLSLVDLHDVAAVAAMILQDESGRYRGATLELAGTVALSQVDVAGVLGQVAGRPVRAAEQPLADWEAGAAGLPDYARQTLLAMFRYYARYGLVGSPLVLEHLLGRPPTSLAACAAHWPAGAAWQ